MVGIGIISSPEDKKTFYDTVIKGELERECTGLFKIMQKGNRVRASYAAFGRLLVDLFEDGNDGTTEKLAAEMLEYIKNHNAEVHHILVLIQNMFDILGARTGNADNVYQNVITRLNEKEQED